MIEDGAKVSTDANYSFTASAKRNLLANFIEKKFELMAKLSGQGSVEKQPDKALIYPEKL
ncbi:hypothetical protein [Mesotoga sp.]|uniref:hypothetical protein n=1 Tax=Mesotoga sp. TaxID=2053577 RepID=UPI00345E8F8A